MVRIGFEMENIILVWPAGLYIIVGLGFLFYLNNLIRLLILLELFILANSVLLVVLIFYYSTSTEHYELIGSIPLFLAVAAADAAVGLGLLVVLYRRRKNLHPEDSLRQSEG